MWFNREKEKRMQFLRNFVPTSKAQLLQVAMFFNNGDTAKAQEMYDFYAKNLDLPDFEPIQPSLLQQVKGGAADIFSWIKENQGDIVQGIQFIQGIVKNKGLFPIQDAVEPLPDINE